MNIIWDKYFFEVLISIVGSTVFLYVFGYYCLKHPRVGRIAYLMFLIVGISYPLAECSNIIAKDFRPTTSSKDEKR